jgi:hypothetical protein
MTKRYFYVALEQALVGFIDLLNANRFDVGGDAVFGAEIEHLLRLRMPPMLDPASWRRFIRSPKTATGRGCSGAPTNVRVPSRFSRST